MSKFSTTDILHASLTINGNELTHQCLSGITNLTELMRIIRHHAAGATGLASLRLRNASQGWSEVSQLYLY